MSSKFDSFAQSNLGAFRQSPIGNARAGGFGPGVLIGCRQGVSFPPFPFVVYVERSGKENTLGSEDAFSASGCETKHMTNHSSLGLFVYVEDPTVGVNIGDIWNYKDGVWSKVYDPVSADDLTVQLTAWGSYVYASVLTEYFMRYDGASWENIIQELSVNIRCAVPYGSKLALGGGPKRAYRDDDGLGALWGPPKSYDGGTATTPRTQTQYGSFSDDYTGYPGSLVDIIDDFDGRLYCGEDSSDKIYIWNLGWSTLTTLPQHATDFHVFSDRMWFANNTTTLRYTENHSSITTITLSTAVEYLANDGKYLWAGGGNTVYLIDPTTDTVYDSFSLTKMLSIASMLTYTPE